MNVKIDHAISINLYDRMHNLHAFVVWTLYGGKMGYSSDTQCSKIWKSILRVNYYYDER